MIYVYGKFKSGNSRFTFTHELTDSAFKNQQKYHQPFFQYVFLYGHTYYILSNILH